MVETEGRPGLIDLSDRILKELLRTPKFKAQVKIVLASLDPPAAARLVRTLMWEDAELFLDLAGSVPGLLNAALAGGEELVGQMDRYPTPLLAAFLAQILDRIDGETLGALLVNAAGLIVRLHDVPGEPLQRSAAELGRRVGRGAAAGAAGAGTAETLLSVLRPLLQRQIRRLSDEAGIEGSETQKFISGLSAILSDALRHNPDFRDLVCKPLLEPFRAVAEGGPGDSE